MPSLLSKFRHRKTGSQSSNSSVDAQQPPSPSRRSHDSPSSSRARLSLDQPSPRGRASLDQPPTPTRRLPQPPVPTSRTEEDVIVIDKAPSSVHDTQGHSRPFVDESERPDLPTTSSNVNNPLPQSHPSGSTTYLPQEELDKKPLPAVPEVQSPPIHGHETSSFPLPPKDTITKDTSLPERTPHHDRVRSPPLPHVDSINRQALRQSEEERPGLVGSSSRPAKSGEQVRGNYPHVSNLPHSNKEEDLNELLEQGTNDKVEIPSRGSSLYHNHQGQGPSSSSVQQNHSRAAEMELQEHRRDGKFTKPSSAVDPTSKHPDGILNERFNDLSIGEGGGVMGLDEQRDAMISKISEQIETKEEVSREGVQVFKNIGMDHLLGKEDSIDIRSRELEPVVKETIYPVEHTEYTTILTRCIHKTHYIPLIQPIHDPNPIFLATRHRIYNPTTKKWHEVIGDAAAISILGEDVFKNGPKEYRELRKPALPGLEPMDEDAIRMAKEAGLVSGGGLHTATGIKDYEYTSNAQDNIPIKGEHADVSIDGIGQGEGKGRVLEREYVLGTEDEEEKGDWKEIASYVGIGGGKGGLRRARGKDDQVGVAL
ncbi:hypothetical protein I302_104551 [Kwoniella bestiolae CBS 10118]|uniref:Uncharacterized protein n=1 Tax=Kwoniella bestiolae CBS 10118 TaxID=1296100 RepID=A0A1B9GBK0_9TREE|nr:hypothetical protein I302_03256 [Kwoniella bestiolae CBS 10118]OCF28397.1 hypothetical protein I302_03256 [Kwoniella bestiolae CBS 10118]